MHSYNSLKRLAHNVALPAMFVDLDLFDANVHALAKICRATGKTWRPATKSIRVPALLKRLQKIAGETQEGWMCFSIFEASYLYAQNAQGFDDLLIAYPLSTESEYEEAFKLLEKGCNFHLMIDSAAHVANLSSFLSKKLANDKRNLHFQVCIDVDMSWRPLGLLHLGVHRSPIRSLPKFKEVFSEAQKSDFVLLTGVMGYEAQIAGLPDHNRFNRWQNPIKALIRLCSKKHVLRWRAEIVGFLETYKARLRFFNGGGTGSFEFAAHDPSLSEITSGSGPLQSQLFDYYRETTAQKVLRPALFFALPVCRIPDSKRVTLKSGGFIASGEVGPDRSPFLYRPEVGKLTSGEGAGEVQTPVQVPDSSQYKLGDPFFFRPAKAGEIAEHFNHYVLYRDEKVEESVPTYRGLGLNFF
ncbi:MAG TPA: amino acid aldolase [Bdellovibrionales bacterium]|nr:amino acid aldolase [Bdellovibrionales bacterium]